MMPCQIQRRYVIGRTFAPVTDELPRAVETSALSARYFTNIILLQAAISFFVDIY